MDRLIKRFDFIKDGDLAICDARGVAYQRDMGRERVEYGEDYLAKVQAYEGSAIAERVNAGRCELMRRHLPAGARVLDYGAGSGAFMRAAASAGYEMSGFDVIPQTAQWLRESGAFAEDPGGFEALTLWDTVEHIEDPENILKNVPKGGRVFVSVPVFESLRAVRGSKHYRPGEHLYYWTERGFVDWMAAWGFRLLESSAHEVEAGREAIGAFAFVRDLPDFHDHIGLYQRMHSERFYGSSATELHLADAARVVAAVAPRTILDYGCGRSDLLAHFWRDGRRTLAKFDPAIAEFKSMPAGRFDLVLCCDVLEHIPLAGVDRVLAEVKAKGDRVFFTISTKLARAKLPDGRNAHVTLLTRSEWKRWVAEVFGAVTELPSKWEHELVLFASPTGRESIVIPRVA